LYCGRCLNVLDDFTKESIVIEVDTSISGLRVARVLDRIAMQRLGILDYRDR